MFKYNAEKHADYVRDNIVVHCFLAAILGISIFSTKYTTFIAIPDTVILIAMIAYCISQLTTLFILVKKAPEEIRFLTLKTTLMGYFVINGLILPNFLH